MNSHSGLLDFCGLQPAGGTIPGYGAVLLYLGRLWFIFLLASLRTNAIFVWIFATVDVTAWTLAASYFESGDGNSGSALRLQKVSFPFAPAVYIPSVMLALPGRLTAWNR